MSAPETNVEKQVRRHRGPLYGITIAIVIATVLFLSLLGWTAYQGDAPGEEDPAVNAVPAAQTSAD